LKGLQYFPFERNHYYYGKFLSADVLDAEQKYMNDKRRFLNRFLHGSGVIFGMSVLSVDSKSVAVQPGAALDYAGREIVIDQPLLLNLATLDGNFIQNNAAVVYLCLEYDEYPQQSQYPSENSGEYDTVSEHYHFFLTTSEPHHSMGMAQQFIMQTETIYSCDAYTVQQQLPVMVRAGSEAIFTVRIQRQIRDAVFKFSYQVRLTGMKYREDRVITISYDSQTQPLQGDTAVLKFPLHILLHADGEEACVETVLDSFLSSFDQQTSGFSVCRMNTEIVVNQLQERLLRKFRDEGMQQIQKDNVWQPPICLAAIHMGEDNSINRIVRMPFSQYISSNLDSELQSFLRHEEHDERQRTDIQENSRRNDAEKLMQQYAVASGVTEIAMPMGGRAGQCFYSGTISHGLGIGQTAVTLGMITSETETIYGDTYIFAESRQDVCANLAAKLDAEHGTFVIGIRLTEPTAATHIRVHWTAVHSHTEEVIGHHPRMLIKPNLASLCVMENLTFEVQFEQMPKQTVQWSIAEGARGGVITDGGAYTAPNTPGVYQINVKAVESGIQATAFVSVRDL